MLNYNQTSIVINRKEKIQTVEYLIIEKGKEPVIRTYAVVLVEEKKGD